VRDDSRLTPRAPRKARTPLAPLSRRGLLRMTAAAAALTVPRAARAQRRAVTLKVLARDYTLRLDSPWRPAAAELKRRHPELDINVELEGSPYNDQRRKALISTGQGADIIQMDNIWLGEFAEGGIIQDNTARFNAWSDKGDVPTAREPGAGLRFLRVHPFYRAPAHADDWDGVFVKA
jgi:ABC-type glycerol-3-phosphate transport system substrate-binding protein